eukprot:7476834-Pyramimonas_sp.AAC.1
MSTNERGPRRADNAGPQKATTGPLRVATGPRRTARGPRRATAGPRKACTWGHDGRERAGATKGI